jgi:hypothetical protein
LLDDPIDRRDVPAIHSRRAGVHPPGQNAMEDDTPATAEDGKRGPKPPQEVALARFEGLARFVKQLSELVETMGRGGVDRFRLRHVPA